MNWYRNLKISAKLIIGFLIVALVSGLIGFLGVMSLNDVTYDAKLLYENAAAPLAELSEVLELYQENRVELRNLILVKESSDLNARIDEIYQKADQIIDIMAENKKTAVEESTKVLYEDFDSAYENYLIIMDNIMEHIKNGNKEEASAMLLDTDMAQTAAIVQDALESLVEKKEAGALGQYEKINTTSGSTKLSMIIFSGVGVAIALILGFIISHIISTPITQMVEIAEKMALGDINVAIESKYKDETGRLANAFQSLIDNIKQETVIAERMANGDFSFDVNIRSEKDVLGRSLNQMINRINDLLSNIVSSAGQVAGGAKQISDSSLILSEGSTEQASSIEELTASLEEISSQTELNADNANKANELTKTVKLNADRSNDQMKEMLKAMDEINISSSSINKIIKVIDDIAFQTNILALNAAVEAARAGQYGKGFAVVAEEVRTLAAKSADAAKETTELIENSIHKVNEGTKIASETAESLNFIVNEISQVYDLINEIATASNEQATGISQINQGIVQVSDVVQTNSATAEEGAAASEELARQAEILKDLVSNFKLKNTVKGNNSINNLDPEILEMIDTMMKKNKEEGSSKNKMTDSNTGIMLSDNEFGKY